MSASEFFDRFVELYLNSCTFQYSIDPERVKSSDWSALEDPSVYLTFESHLTSENKRFRLCSKVAFLDDSLNVAVLEVAPSPEALPPPLALSRKNISSVGVSDVAVIGYGHRGSVSKHLDTKCAIIQPESDRAKQVRHFCSESSIIKEDLKKVEHGTSK